MADVIRFPSVRKTLVISCQAGAFRVTMEPALNEAERIFVDLPNLGEARAYADELILLWSDVFGRVEDRTQVPR
ncbi:MAG: hypothetical protein U5M50_11090 [Sphingobium sp.]|nr:hypothetical protein [Sphingobium sp.]